MYLGVRYLLGSDPDIAAAGQFVSRDEDVILRAGQVISVDPLKRVAVGASAAERGYRIYTLGVRGTKGTVHVIVRADVGDGREPATYQILSIAP
jgi:hypothetical protein